MGCHQHFTHWYNGVRWRKPSWRQCALLFVVPFVKVWPGIRSPPVIPLSLPPQPGVRGHNNQYLSGDGYVCMWWDRREPREWDMYPASPEVMVRSVTLYVRPRLHLTTVSRGPDSLPTITGDPVPPVPTMTCRMLPVPEGCSVDVTSPPLGTLT